MSTCRWCTPLVLSATELLQKYCSGQLLADEERALNEDLCFCLDCVVEYHRARDELPSLHKRLWELEISRLLARFSQVSEEELEDDLLIVEDEQEIHVPKITGAEFENFLRVPLTEVLRYPYLMAHPKLCDMCVDALCKMEKSNSLQVFEKLQGIYLLLVHPNEEVRRWAIRTAKSLGKVDRDDFYDLKDVFCSMFRVLDLDLFHNSDVYSYIPENSKNALLPHHLYDAKNPKDYWLDESSDPFWPSLQCFMVILDRLGSKIWGQLIEPTCPFQTITGSPSYTAEIENIRRNTMFKVKVEMEPDDDFVTCSQIIYDCNTKEKQLDMGKDMRVHNSTFLWFIPFVQSVMDLNNHSIVYIGEIIHYLTPAIVPPKKERKPVEPVSPAEKLGLIKRKRKAFEFSQRSTACIKKLRKHGQGVHVEQKQWTQRGKKSKLITPQKLNIRGHRKLLASQDLQYFRQSRGKLHSLHSEAENKLTAERGPMETKLPKISNTKIHIPKPNVADGEDVFLPSLPLRHDPMTDGGARTAGQSLQDKPSFSEINSTESRPSSSTIIEDENLHADQVQSSKSLLTNSLIDAITSTVNNKCDDMSIAQEDGDTSDLTQNDPVDMEICSQMEEEDDIFLTQRDPVDMDIDLESQICPENKSEERVSTSHPGDDHIFLKPGISPSPLKKSKPPTTKIYASSSRSETLVQEMKKTASKPLPVGAKSKIRPSLPVKNTSTPQSDSSLFRQPVPLTTPVSLRPHSFQSGPVGSSLQVPTYKTYARPEAPVVKAMPHNDTGPKFDQAYLIKAILKWNYEMFFSYSQFGIPSDLCHFQLKEVANNYRSYDEYFGTFYPLLLINTFEEDQDAKYQQYPKEDDLVILWLPQNKSACPYDMPHLQEPQAHFGCVSRSNLISGVKNILNITIQTYGNVSSVNNQSVKCELVGSLVSAIREFKALCFLKNNPMVRALLVPHVTFFRPGPDRILNLSLPDYNPEQIKAISCGLSVVRGHDRTPKICLIHGPPGTGKSRTIVGLLQRLFSEGVENLRSTSSCHTRAPKLRVLLCTPSNAAIDSLMKKIILVFKDSCRDRQNPQGNCGDINLVRLGLEKTISKHLKPFSLDNQTRSRTRKAQHGHDVDIQRKEQLDQCIEVLSQKVAMVEKGTEMTRSRRQETQAKVLQDAHIICCTLSTSGSVLLESAFRRLGHKPFSCVIVDEAGQATETETLIPLLYRCPALILVGDPEQLPPTVVSQTAKEKRYDQSLMARLRKCLHGMGKGNPQMNNPVIFLNRQYRMHPDICEFPSKYIYNRELMTDDETAQKRCAVNWPFQPYRLFDVTDGREVKDGDSFYNQKEVRLVRFLLKLIAEKQVGKVGVITPYNAQKHRILDSISAEWGREENRNFQVEVDTVDGFQGREMDCVIVSCVRASSELGSIGFLGNRQRLNVTITRAKSSLFILGHLRTLKEQKDWGALIDDACKRGTIIKTSENYFRKHAMQIFKPEGLRGLSSKVPSLPFRVGSAEGGPFRQRAESMCAATTFAGRAEDRPAPIHSHRMSDPLPLCDVKKASAPAQPPVRPTAAERPRDPRLSVWTETSTVWPPHTRSEGHDDAVSPQDPAPLPQDPSPAPVVQCRKEPSHFSGYSSSRERHQQPQQRSYEWGYRDPHQSGPDRQTSSGSSYPSQYPYSQMIKRSSDSQYTAAPSAKRQ
ncbi:putative helicase senataxin, partial [Scleropages formosus]